MRVAGIVVYNPDSDRLCQNVRAIGRQVDSLVIYRNSLFDTAFLEEYDNVVLQNDGTNNGIGTALNSIMAFAEEQGAEWCLLLDQDSVVSEGYLDRIEKYCSLEHAGIITPRVIDENEHSAETQAETNGTEAIEMCITSGSYNNVAIWRETGCFRDEFFIDYIDWEYCARIRKNGYKVYRANEIILHHELGKRTYHRLLGTTLYTFNHNAFRKYYITRNTIVTYRLYPYEKSLAHPYLRALKRWLIAVLWETDKMKKTKAIAKGIIDSGSLYRAVRGKQ